MCVCRIAAFEVARIFHKRFDIPPGLASPSRVVPLGAEYICSNSC